MFGLLKNDKDFPVQFWCHTTSTKKNALYSHTTCYNCVNSISRHNVLTLQWSPNSLEQKTIIQSECSANWGMLSMFTQHTTFPWRYFALNSSLQPFRWTWPGSSLKAPREQPSTTTAAAIQQVFCCTNIWKFGTSALRNIIIRASQFFQIAMLM